YRLGLMQWVSGAAATRQGWIDVGDFSSVDYIKQLADKANKAERDRVFKAFRDPEAKEQQQYGIPYMVGSGIDYDASPKHWYNMPDHQYWLLQQWHAGNYDNDFTGEPQPGPCDIEQVPLADRPEALTRAALEPLSGGNFHPGVELTWVLGQGALFDDAEPFRIKVGNRPSLDQPIGPLITVDNVFPPKNTPPTQASYPIGPQMPGDLTRWMGLPWQPDAFSCQNVNFANDFPTVVWWPALLPVDVMPEYAFDKLSCPTLTREEKLKFASLRVAWARGAAGIGYHANASYFDGLNRMVYLVDKMGVVVKKKTPVALTKGVNKLPEYMFVEVDRGSMDLEFNEAPNLGKCFDKQGA
ncbi:MAG: LodA/GoxA family CTQ-dependent oxidase, partial [Psychrosphaera sp.]|nr:LodA/GoxA family CTQ-dependent oxidase [Psychrosphaera sp.]